MQKKCNYKKRRNLCFLTLIFVLPSIVQAHDYEVFDSNFNAAWYTVHTVLEISGENFLGFKEVNGAFYKPEHLLTYELKSESAEPIMKGIHKVADKIICVNIPYGVQGFKFYESEQCYEILVR